MCLWASLDPRCVVISGHRIGGLPTLSIKFWFLSELSYELLILFLTELRFLDRNYFLNNNNIYCIIK